MFSWIKSRWKPIAIGAALTAATAVGVFYPGAPSSTMQRPLLSGYTHASREYLNRHAQDWLICPAAATKCFRWKMQESSGNITDDLSGDSAVLTANGTPTYSLFTPIPMSDGFTRTGIHFLASATDYFVSGGNTVGDQTTNDFSAAFWIRIEAPPGADQYIINKYDGSEGFAVLINSSGVIEATIDDSGAATNGAVTAALSTGAWHFVVVKFDRSGDATADVDGVASGVTLDITGNPNTITVASPFQIGRLAAGSNYLDGLLSEVMMADGLMTTAESLAAYKAFKVQTGITFAQTKTRKFPLPPDAKGERLGVYAGSATAPQWPAMYAATLVDATTNANPLGIGFPGWPATINVIGYVNEFDQWVGAGGGGAPTVTANFYEAPDGSMTAEKVQFANGASTLTRAVVGGGNIAAGERWAGSLFYKYVSGTSCDIRLYNGTTAYATLGTGATWLRVQIDGITAAEAKQLQLSRNGGTDCIYAFSDAQYEADNLTPPCTSTIGAVSQTCNASYYTASWTDKLSHMPSLYYRGEMEVTAAEWPEFGAPLNDNPLTAGYLLALGSGNGIAVLTSMPSHYFVLQDSGGTVEGYTVGKPMQEGEEKHVRAASWDTDKASGITNTNPRRYISFTDNNITTVHPPVLSPIPYNATSQIPYSPIYKNDYDGNQTTVVGFNSFGVIERTAVYARPSQTVRPDDSTLVINADFSSHAYLEAQAIPRFECPSGVDSADCWIWDTSEYSGSLYDRINDVALAPSGTPRYQAWTGLLARGNGRRSINFNRSSESLEASSTSVLDPSGWTQITGEAIYRQMSWAGWQQIFGSNNAGDNDGYCLMTEAGNGTVYAWFKGGGAWNYCKTNAVLALGEWHHVSFTSTLSGTWSNPVIYVDGVSVAVTCAGVGASGAFANGKPFVVGGGDGAYWFEGQIAEVRVRNTADSAATILARYKQTIQDGTYWIDDANTVAHYAMNESFLFNGTGIRDRSGNGNHLTVVNGTPDPRYFDMPWPAGTGLVKQAVEYAAAGDHHDAGSGVPATPSNAQSFSLIGWFRTNVVPAAAQLLIAKGAANDYYDLAFDASGQPRFRFNTSEAGLATTTTAVVVTDGAWHLLAAKVVHSGGTYTPYISIDGGAFAYNAGSTTTGDPSGNASNLALGTGLAATPVGHSGVMILKDYALSDAEVASYYLAGTSPVDDLVYARTNKACFDVDNDPVTGIKVRCFQANEVPFAFHPSMNGDYNDRLGFGLPVHDAVTNIALQSQDATTTWANNNTSDSANTAAAPDGTFTADTVTATAGAGDLRQVFGTIAASAHTYCQYLKRNGASDVAGFLRLVTNSTHAVVASTAFTATSAWQRFCVTGTATLNDTRVETEITADTESVFWWGASLSTYNATNFMVYCPTAAATVTCNATSSNYIPAASMSTWTRAQGVINWTGVSNNAGGYGFDLHNGANLNGALRLLAPTTEAYIYDSSGTLQQRISLANAQTNTLTSATVVFDDSTEFYTDQTQTARHAYGATYQSSYHGAWPTYTTDLNGSWTPAAATDLHIGQDNAAGNCINGLIRNLTVFGKR